MVAASAIGSCIYGLVEPSPTDPSKTLLNADIALQFVPAMLFGVSLGVHQFRGVHERGQCNA